ncbi:RNA polymerase sigma-70 factor [Phytoactinopolyspora halophila]|uniref:RNA polymerase sigma-70 factor n=1 Tax=Phytoactinopolyspora halophila TaxID=1981511 RepID=UPI0013DE0071|nr:RNA polymerase sigma-70 factor [Phytoactinopolyspora halophila]
MSDPFDQHRRLLFTVAYEMLGNVADAEDVVQDTWLRWSAADRSDVADPRAYLVRITTRLSLNRLRTLRTQRETYVGSWLPEPLITSPDAATDVERAEDVSMAMLVVLETLAPLERAVFVLREVFGLPHAEIATVLERSEASVRQLARRARQHVHERRPRFDTDPAQRQEVTSRFLQAAEGGDVQALVGVLAPDVVMISDSGGKAKAPRHPVVTADRVARTILGIVQKDESQQLEYEYTELNYAPAVVGWRGDEPRAALLFEIQHGCITRLLLFRNPERMAGLARAGTRAIVARRSPDERYAGA